MKVIFLDIDGVLNSNDWYVKTRGVGGYNGGDVDPECIEEFDGNSTEWEEYGGEVYGREG